MSTTVCYTAVFGGYDTLKPHPEMDNVDFIAITDRPMYSPYWEVHVMPSNHQCFQQNHPRMQAKWFKMHPDIFFPDYKNVLWVDSSQTILTAHYADRCAAAVTGSGIAVHDHPEPRDCVYQEAPYSLEVHPAKYNNQPLIEQVNHYRTQGFPEHQGLYACGTIATVDSPDCRRVMSAWWDENVAWSYQDQLSLPYVCWRNGVRPSTFPWGQSSGQETIVGGHLFMG